jgi:cytochrome bd ubiquinol oxidase subunit II
VINTLWFLVLSAMLVGYAILDGFDLGVGTLHLGVARSDGERETAINTIGPVWNGNEVWLIAAGGAMVAAFPHLYATAFSGFYLPLMIVLWLLILRGVSIELRHQVDNPLWRQAWDVTFSVSSGLLTVMFGVAIGNVLRGVPLDAEGNFQGSLALLLNPFALLCGVLSAAALALHGALYLAMKTEGQLQHRARRTVLPLWGVTVVILAAVATASFVVQPGFTANFGRWPALGLLPLAAACAAAGVAWWHRQGRDAASFVASSGLIATVLGSAAAGLYPRLLPSISGSQAPALDIYNSASSTQSMTIALGIYLAGMAIAVVYSISVYRVWRGKVGEGYTRKARRVGH